MESESQTDYERPLKRAYLRQEIVEKGYSPEEFTDYCDNLKGADIDLWTLEELKGCVSKFQTSSVQRASDESPLIYEDETQVKIDEKETAELQEEAKATVEIKIETQITEKTHNQFTPKDLGIEVKNYTITGMRIADTQLSKAINIDVIVGTPEISAGGMFSSTKINFAVCTKPLNWNVKRQEEDFVWIKGILSTCFPASYLPPNPPKRVKGAHSEENQYKQQAYLQHFLDTIVRNPLFQRSPYLVGFLKEEDVKTFNQLKKQSNSVKRPVDYDEYLTLDGYVMCDPKIDEKEDSNIEEYLKTTQNLKKKLKRQTDQLGDLINQVSGVILDIARSYEGLENIQDKFPNIPGVKTLYSSLKTSFAIWSDREVEAAKIVKKYCNFFFKYGYNEVKPLLEMLKDKDNKRTNYQKSILKLNKKKEKLWSSNDTSKWGLSAESLQNVQSLLEDKERAFSSMLYKENKETEKLKDDFAFFNYQVKAETARIFIDNQTKENSNFTDFGKAYIDHTTRIHELWADLVTTLVHVRHECIQAFPSSN